MSRKIVLAAGGSRRYRKSDALKLAEQVHNVIIKYLTKKGRKPSAVQYDVRDLSSPESFVEKNKKVLGGWILENLIFS